VEYTEGPKALENFKKLATAILQAPAKKKKQSRVANSRKSKRAIPPEAPNQAATDNL
jgi:hypothetical protein